MKSNLIRRLVGIGCLFLCLAIFPAAPGWSAEGFDFNQMTETQERQLMFPYLVSADDFREEGVEARAINLNSMLRGEDPELARRKNEYEQRLRRLEQGYGKRPQSFLRHKVGLLYARGNFPSQWSRALLQAAPDVMAGNGFVYLGPEFLQPVLAGFRPAPGKSHDPRALAGYLADYPGARYLLFLQGARMLPGATIALDYFWVDAYAGIQFPQRSVTAYCPDSRQYQMALGNCLNQIVAAQRSLAQGSAVQGRVFQVKGGLVYLNIGVLSGLRAGQTLEVLSPAQPVYDPRSGVVVGLAAGRPCGRLRVIQGFGYDLAEARLEAGWARTGDLVEMR